MIYGLASFIGTILGERVAARLSEDTTIKVLNPLVIIASCLLKLPGIGTFEVYILLTM